MPVVVQSYVHLLQLCHACCYVFLQSSYRAGLALCCTHIDSSANELSGSLVEPPVRVGSRVALQPPALNSTIAQHSKPYRHM